MKCDIYLLALEIELAVPADTDREKMKLISRELGETIEIALTKHNAMVGKININGERVSGEPVEFTQH